jgi:hypothetical protein
MVYMKYGGSMFEIKPKPYFLNNSIGRKKGELSA